MHSGPEVTYKESHFLALVESDSGENREFASEVREAVSTLQHTGYHLAKISVKPLKKGHMVTALFESDVSGQPRYANLTYSINALVSEVTHFEVSASNNPRQSLDKLVAKFPYSSEDPIRDIGSAIINMIRPSFI